MTAFDFLPDGDDYDADADRDQYIGAADDAEVPTPSVADVLRSAMAEPALPVRDQGRLRG